MKHKIAELIGNKARALKHCDKIIAIIDKQGRTDIMLGNTGVVLPCEKNDAIYTLLQSVRFKLAHEINSIEIVSRSNAPSRMLPAPNGACDDSMQGICESCGCVITKTSNHQRFCKECAAVRRKESWRRSRQKRTQKR